jgi:hypothetical protein
MYKFLDFQNIHAILKPGTLTGQLQHGLPGSSASSSILTPSGQ